MQATDRAILLAAKALWCPDMPWEDVRQCYLVAGLGEHMGFAGEYVEPVMAGAVHRLACPFADGYGILTACGIMAPRQDGPERKPRAIALSFETM